MPPQLKTSVFCGVSVDGFLARPNHTFDFLDTPGAGPHGFEEHWRSIDVVVIGRKTFEVVLGFREKWGYGKMPVEPAEIVAELAKRGFKHAYVDGGITIQRFLAAGLIDRMVVTRVPVLIGEGIPLFGPVPRDVNLRHIATRTYRGGLVQSEYEIGGEPRKGARKKGAAASSRKKRQK